MTCIAVSSDGSFVASGQQTHLGYDADIIIWDYATKKQLHRCTLHKQRVQSLAFSADGVTWQYSEVPPYTGTVRWANGTADAFARVERPVLLFGAGGRPTHLINGVQRFSHDDYTFTLLRPLAAAAHPKLLNPSPTSPPQPLPPLQSLPLPLALSS